MKDFEVVESFFKLNCVKFRRCELCGCRISWPERKCESCWKTVGKGAEMDPVAPLAKEKIACGHDLK